MQQQTILLIIVGLLAIGFVALGEACELDQTQHGCRIENGACTCAYGCRSDFRYATRKECQDSLKGRSGDICSRVPCLNGGNCIQVSKMPGYICQCDGTGYWGSRCQRACPNAQSFSSTSGATYPHECIVI